MIYFNFPWPFMVERGHHDLVGRDRWVAYEYAKTRWLYTQLELGDRSEIEYFNGVHTINAEGDRWVPRQASELAATGAEAFRTPVAVLAFWLCISFNVAIEESARA